jgi:glucoamylase
MWLPGSSYWQGHQKDQAALPILLLAKCYEYQVFDAERMARYWPMVKRAIHYLLMTGPYTEQDRWEEERGFSPFTLAAVIAGLLAGADIAELNKHPELAGYCRETADSWNNSVEDWTFVSDTALARKYGVHGYYIRINPYRDIPAAELQDRNIDLKNHSGNSGTTRLNELVSVDALALVRFGLRESDDPRILDTIKVIDAMLKVDTPGGPCWHRYNNDGYGEHEDGTGFDGTGIGRAWPLLTGERAHYEIARGHFAEAEALLTAMDSFANEGLIPEQIWDYVSIPEKELFLGKHSGSGMPLTWAHAEYIKLCVSLRDKAVFDTPRQTANRYLRDKRVSAFTVWRFDSPCMKMAPDKVLRIEVMAEAVVHWTDDGWATVRQTAAADRGMGIYVADLASEKPQTTLVFTFFWRQAQCWEGRNFSVKKGADSI